MTNDQIRTEGKYKKKNDMEKWKKNDEINDIKLFEKKLEKSVGSFVKIATH